MFALICDIYQLTETNTNAEPADIPTLLYSDVSCGFIRMSGNTRYLAAGAGLSLSRRLALEMRSGVDERCEVRNLRTKEGTAVADEPGRYRIVYAARSQRGFHLELDLEAWK